MLVATDNPKDGSRLESKVTNPLANQSRAGSLDGFGAKQWVHDCPCGLFGN